MKELSVVCCLYRGGGWRRDLYSPEWVDKLYRAVSRNLSSSFRFICLTDYAPSEFQESVEVVPFVYAPHVGTWMSINEVFRPDLRVELGLFMGLDTVVGGNLDALADYQGKVAMARDHTASAAATCNAVVLWDGPSMTHLWERYMDDPAGVCAACRAPATWMEKGTPSEMIYWRTRCDHAIDTLEDVFPKLKMYDYSLHVATRRPALDATLGGAQILYFHGTAKPSNRNHPYITEHWI